ncbi:MAG: Permease of the drug/metabolite transporter (DMT) superfamily [uncultured Thermomicrobiales bacterium]|uniref:Permease of the drug/metabolite transporter (DMT) superfamily n=1 Tax=uncultured Thermomicrobiales bacterium TaxID=1645740 RepID=A0A6J4UZD2_9BACT|nr:MAG: Permease of the drug/metabolite transporter (DMT) superfamily [uncultured Thermomicrobiales bacterium]
MSRWLWMMIGVATIWGAAGAAFPFTKPALDQVPPATFTALRFALVALILTPLALLARRRATGRPGLGLARRDWPRLVTAGIVGYVVSQVGQNWALSLSPSSDIAIIAATQAVWIVALGAIFLREAVAPRAWLGLLCCLGGVLIITGVNPLDPAAGGGAAGSGRQRAAGDLLFLLASICWAIYNLLTRPLSARNPPLSAMAAMSLVGTIGLLHLALAEQAGWLHFWGVTARARAPLTGPVVGGIAYSAVLVSVVGLLVLLVAYQHLRVAQVAVTFYVSPLTGVLVAVVWLDEPLRTGLVLGLPLILLGLYLATRHPDMVPAKTVTAGGIAAEQS